MTEITQTPDYQYYVGKPPFRLPVQGRIVFFVYTLALIGTLIYACWTQKINADLRQVQHLIATRTTSVTAINDQLSAQISALAESDKYERVWMPLAQVRQTASKTMSEVLTTIPPKIRLEAYEYEQQSTGLTDATLHMATTIQAKNRDEVVAEAQNFLDEYQKYSKSRVPTHDGRIGSAHNIDLNGIDVRTFSTDETWSIDMEVLEPKQVISIYRELDKEYPIVRTDIGAKLHLGGIQ